jgi:shikimate 5-dehydrogenase
MQRIFPRWMAELGLPSASLRGIDLPLNAPAADYRAAVESIAQDPDCAGALVTSHKIGVLEAARDLFVEIDEEARLCGELNGISKRGDGGLGAHALDPGAARASLLAFLGDGYFGRHSGAEVLCLGSGGAATAIAVQFGRAAAGERPRRMTLVDRDPAKLDRLRGIVPRLDTTVEFRFACHSEAERNDALAGGLPPGSLVINATGMGKDLPGSPVTPACRWPHRGAAWELNYRGELDFLKIARAQSGVMVEDGWIYFLHGWTQVVSAVYGVPIEGETFQRLAGIAGVYRLGKI